LGTDVQESTSKKQHFFLKELVIENARIKSSGLFFWLTPEMAPDHTKCFAPVTRQDQRAIGKLRFTQKMAI